MYTAEVTHHFEHPHNVGEIPHPDASVLLDNPGCGDILRLTLKITGDRIEDIRFRAQGCVPMIACGSVLTELAKGKTIADARTLHHTQIVDALGHLPSASTHASHLAIRALNTALDQLESSRRG